MVTDFGLELTYRKRKRSGSILGVLTRIFENFDFLRSSESTFFFSNPYKTPEMNELDIELSKKSKIIEIGSVEKKLQLFKVGGFSKKSENPGIFVQLI